MSFHQKLGWKHRRHADHICRWQKAGRDIKHFGCQAKTQRDPHKLEWLLDSKKIHIILIKSKDHTWVLKTQVPYDNMGNSASRRAFSCPLTPCECATWSVAVWHDFSQSSYVSWSICGHILLIKQEPTVPPFSILGLWHEEYWTYEARHTLGKT